MPLYAFACQHCARPHEVFAPIQDGPPPDLTCLDCRSPLRRVYTVPAVKAPYQDHFNESVGSYVRSDREFRDKLKQGAQDTYEQTGYETNYVPMEVGDLLASTDKDESQQKRMWEESRG